MFRPNMIRKQIKPYNTSKGDLRVKLNTNPMKPSRVRTYRYGILTTHVFSKGLSESTSTEWSLPVVLKHRDPWLYMITLKRSQSTVNVLYKT